MCYLTPIGITLCYVFLVDFVFHGNVLIQNMNYLIDLDLVCLWAIVSYTNDPNVFPQHFVFLIMLYLMKMFLLLFHKLLWCLCL